MSIIIEKYIFYFFYRPSGKLLGRKLNKDINKWGMIRYEYGIRRPNRKKSVRSFNESIECLDKALEIEPNNALTIFTKATTLIFLGDEEGADKYFNEAVKLNPEYTKERE